MSLILEALRKSEERRKLGEAPTLISESAWSSRRRHPLARSDSRTPWVVGALLLAALAAGAWWWWSRTPVVATQPEPARTARAATAAPAPRPTPAAPVASAPAPVPSPSLPTPAAVAAATPMPMPPAATQEELAATDARIKEELAVSRGAAPVAPTMPEPEPPPVAAATPEPMPAAPLASAAPAPVPSATPTPIAAAPPAAAALPALPEIWQLPLPTRQALPALALTMHVYSADPAQRFALINDKRVGENSPLDNGLDVREIRPDGVVLEFRGERFLLPREGR